MTGAPAPNTAVLFLAHETSPATLAAFAHLRQTSGPEMAVTWLLDRAATPAVPAELSPHIETFDSRQFAQWGYATFGERMLPGHCHFPVLRYFEQHPEPSYLWTVEYDVRFTGDWSTLFGHFADHDADLLVPHLRTPQQEPRWHWWDSMRSPDGTILAEGRKRCLLVVARYSGRALRLLSGLHARGWRGHQEVAVPTLLDREGLLVQDLNAVRRCFYTSRTSTKGKLSGWGTVRYRPPMHHAGLRRNMLYHPVKSAVMSEAAMAARRSGSERLGYWLHRCLAKLRW